MHKSTQLVWGATTALLFGVVRWACAFPHAVRLLSGGRWGFACWPAVTLPLAWAPLLGAIGFVVGGLVVVPLVAGIILKQVCVMPLHALFFSHVPESEMIFAWCSGLIFYGVLLSIKELMRWFLSVRHAQVDSLGSAVIALRTLSLERSSLLWWSGVISLNVFVLVGSQFSLLAAIFLIFATALSAYQIMYIGGASGLAPIARYATFIMIPALWLFSLSAMQIAVLSAYVEICGMASVDMLFGTKCGQLGGIDRRDVRIFQVFGLVVSALAIGPVMWMLITKLGVGTAFLPAQRCLTRSLLVGALKRQMLHYPIMGLGLVTGFIFKRVGINPTLALTGVLLPLDFSLLLCIGGLVSYLVKNREEYEPFCSGMFATSALWLVFQVVIGGF